MAALSILDLVRVTQSTDARGALDNARPHAMVGVNIALRLYGDVGFLAVIARRIDARGAWSSNDMLPLSYLIPTQCPPARFHRAPAADPLSDPQPRDFLTVDQSRT